MNEINKSKVVRETSVFPASKQEVFNKLSSFRLLLDIASPYISFAPIDGNENIVWKEGCTYTFKSKLFGFIPCGIHKIRVLKFGIDDGIYTNEQNTYVPVWNHEVVLKKIDENHTEYSDIVEIYAGWKTIFVYLWATLFYKHRQKKWIKILKKR